MSFKIKVGRALFEWKNDKLSCDNAETLSELKTALALHTPEVIALPDLIDYDADLSDGRNAYYAILGTFDNCEILEKPDESFLDYGYEENKIY